METSTASSCTHQADVPVGGGVEDYSYYSMLWTLCNNLGSLVLTPLFHWFNIHDNLIILLCCGSLLSSRVIRGLARTGPVCTINIASCLVAMFWAPIR